MSRFFHLLIILFSATTIYCQDSSITIYCQDSSINVMSFNIRYPNKKDSIHYWDNRRPLVASMIRFHEIDLLGVQEAYRRQLDELVEDMPEYNWYGVCRNDYTTNPDPDDEFSAILYRKDRFELLGGNTFWLSESPDQIGTIGWDANLPRIVTWAKFRDKQTGKIFFHFNTHFDHRGANARNEGAKLLLQRVESIARVMPAIITGDFNCTESEPPYQTLTDETIAYHFTDAIIISQTPHHGPSSSFAGNFMISGLSDRRIDYIFIKNDIEVMKHAILSDSWDGNLASDHLPVFAEVIVH
ncbi:MAG TPA: endonuclease/exonuclease/phosphatase family protein [Saprospiraceae bacterium]|nr:endonuclease/exonuclease/phosphatase family protein [Saprospiraceae bacterium]